MPYLPSASNPLKHSWLKRTSELQNRKNESRFKEKVMMYFSNRKYRLQAFGTFLVLFVALLLSACTSSRKDREIGQYIYQDGTGVWHIDQNCDKLIHCRDENGHRINGKLIVDTTEFRIKDRDHFWVCSKCVDDAAYEHLIKISGRCKYPHISEIDWSTRNTLY